MMKKSFTVLTVLCAVFVLSAVNVRDIGAKGDGKSMGSGKRLTGTIPFHGYRLILVAESPAELENVFKRSNPGK